MSDQRIDLDHLEQLAQQATPGPWKTGMWSMAGVTPERFGEGKCGFCKNHGEPAWVGMADINGSQMLSHRHLLVSDPEHNISTDNGDPIAGNYDWEEGGIIRGEDASYIAACSPETVQALTRAVRAAQEFAASGERDPKQEIKLDALNAALAPFRTGHGE